VERSPLGIHTRSKRPHTLTDDQVWQLQEACRRLRDRFLVTLLYESGLRISEALGLRHADLDPASCADAGGKADNLAAHHGGCATNFLHNISPDIKDFRR
jgi:site-specific recombinase XerC